MTDPLPINGLAAIKAPSLDELHVIAERPYRRLPTSSARCVTGSSSTSMNFRPTRCSTSSGGNRV